MGALKETFQEVRSRRGIVSLSVLICGSLLAYYFVVCLPRQDYLRQHADIVEKLRTMTQSPVVGDMTRCLKEAAGFTVTMIAIAFLARLVAASRFGRRRSP